MTFTGRENLALALDFVKAVEAGKHGDALNEFYHEGIQQVEYPNALTRQLITRSLKDIKDSSISGQNVTIQQTFEVIKSFVAGETVILEVVWTAILAIPIGSKSPGSQMKAYFAQFFEFKNGKIYRQRNYDCFEPFI
ncbi:MAG: nuclear transport factor 2 family protein [Taibaiella sp.]|nr:nuclear transport factor 2 family protein [Taibaiella sp.]